MSSGSTTTAQFVPPRIKGFRFKLETLHRLRQRAFERIHGEFAQALGRLNELKQTKAELDEAITRLLNPDAAQLVDNPMLYHQRFGYLTTLKQQGVQLNQQIVLATHQVNHKQYELRQAHVAKRTLETLWEKQAKAFAAQQDRKAEMALEDQIMMRFGRHDQLKPTASK
ncbi:MAG: hypothetical protein KC462_06750 [Cyanobacteria bacterium HKST-UBA05]|nr:hypothetical protein [Cyanobacteria bacterium HKST-UBA05]